MIMGPRWGGQMRLWLLSPAYVGQMTIYNTSQNAFLKNIVNKDI